MRSVYKVICLECIKDNKVIILKEGRIEMKEFLGTFFVCLVICYMATFFFADLILNNIWALISFIAFILSIFITVFLKQEFRIEKLEKKIEELLNNK